MWKYVWAWVGMKMMENFDYMNLQDVLVGVHFVGNYWTISGNMFLHGWKVWGDWKVTVWKRLLYLKLTHLGSRLWVGWGGRALVGGWGGGGRIVNAMFYSSVFYVHASVTPLNVLQLRLKIKNKKYLFIFYHHSAQNWMFFGGWFHFPSPLTCLRWWWAINKGCCMLLLHWVHCCFCSYTFEMMQQNTDDIWRYMQLQVVMDYSRRPVLPPPVIVFSHLCYLAQCLFRKCYLCQKGRCPVSAFRKSGSCGL